MLTNVRLNQTGLNAVRSITQIVCDPENQPHQWVGESELLENMLLAALAQVEVEQVEFSSGGSTSVGYSSENQVA